MVQGGSNRGIQELWWDTDGSPDTTDTKEERPTVHVLTTLKAVTGAHSLPAIGCFSCRIEAIGSLLLTEEIQCVIDNIWGKNLC